MSIRCGVVRVSAEEVVTKVLLDGRGLVESVRWRRGRVYVADWSAGKVLDDAGEVVARVDSLPLCFDWVGEDMVLVSSAAGRLVRADGSTFAELGESGWNDIAVAGDRVYVNRPDFTGPDGTVHLVHDGRVREVAGGLAFPNGMAVRGDTLFVAESHAHRLTAFDIDTDGSLRNRRTWAEVDGSAPDGICVDGDAVWYADVPNECCVRVAEGGAVLRRVELDRGGFDCVVGDGVLYVAAAEWQGMSEDEFVAPGSGRLLAIPVADPATGSAATARP